MSDQEMTYRQIEEAFELKPKVVRQWKRQGLISSIADGFGPTRFRRADIRAVIARIAAEEREALALLERPPGAEGADQHDDGAALPARLRVVAPGLQADMKRALATVRAGEEAVKRIEHLQALQKMDPAELALQVWERPTGKAAGRLGITSVILEEMCDLNGIPRPPAGYWSVPPAKRGFRISRHVPIVVRTDEAKH